MERMRAIIPFLFFCLMNGCGEFNDRLKEKVMKWRALFCVVLSLYSVQCEDLGESGQIAGTGKDVQVLEDGILYTLAVSKTLFSYGDTLKFSFEVRNASKSVRQFSFPNIEQCGYELKDTNERIALYEPRIVRPATSELTLAPSGEKRYSFLCDFRNDSGQYIAQGEYRLEAFLLFRTAPRVSVRILVSSMRTP